MYSDVRSWKTFADILPIQLSDYLQSTIQQRLDIAETLESDSFEGVDSVPENELPTEEQNVNDGDTQQ